MPVWASKLAPPYCTRHEARARRHSVWAPREKERVCIGGMACDGGTEGRSEIDEDKDARSHMTVCMYAYIYLCVYTNSKKECMV